MEALIRACTAGVERPRVTNMQEETEAGVNEHLAWVEARPSQIHGTGLYAVREIPAETKIIEYIGERISKEESLRRCEAGNPFIFTIDDQTDLDGSIEANLARFINHSCAPNCDAEDHDGRIWIVAREDIPVGAELSYNYNYDFEDYPDNPCQCGAVGCLGYMVAEELFDTVRERLRLKALAAVSVENTETGAKSVTNPQNQGPSAARACAGPQPA